MALIKCPECGKEISDKASACIHCGFPLNNIDQDHTLYNAILETTGPNRAKLNVALRNIRTLSLVEAKNMIDSAPCVIKENISLSEAQQIRKDFADIMAGVKIVAVDGSSSIESPYDKNVIYCPRCGSTQITTGQRGYSFLTGFLGSNKAVNRCAKCGHTWEPRG
jgi:ribosomal protein L7/L12